MSSSKSHVGKKYGLLTVLRYTGIVVKSGHREIECSCECGGSIVTSTKYLRKGTTPNCGCLRKPNMTVGGYLDITGQKFGRLTAIDRTGEKAENGANKWLFKCDCGNDFIHTASRVSNGKVKSCGCYVKEEASKVHTESIERFATVKVYGSCKTSAKQRKIEFNLTHYDVANLILKPCAYCSVLPSTEVTRTTIHNGDELVYVNGIDRVHNDVGYIKGNIVSCCPKCNVAKNDRTVKQFFDWVEKTYYNLYETPYFCRDNESDIKFSKRDKTSYYNRYKDSAFHRRLEFYDDKEFITSFMAKRCRYCGELPKDKPTGIDRVDPLKGYVKGNTVPCCFDCNVSKLDWTFWEFYKWVGRTYTYLIFVDIGHSSDPEADILNFEYPDPENLTTRDIRENKRVFRSSREPNQELGPKCKPAASFLCVELDKVFENQREVFEFLGNPKGIGNVYRACKTGIKAYGYHWRYSTKTDLDQPTDKDV